MFIVLQYLWLLVALGSLVGAVISAYQKNNNEAFILIAITFIGAYMYRVNKKRIVKTASNKSL